MSHNEIILNNTFAVELSKLHHYNILISIFQKQVAKIKIVIQKAKQPPSS